MADIIINPKQGQRIGDYIFRGNSFRKESNAKKIKRNQHVDTNGYRIYNNVAIPFGYKTKSAITWMRSKINKYSLPTKPQLSQEDRRLTNPLLGLNQGGNLIEQKPTPLVPQIPLDLVKNTDPLTLGFTNLTPEVSPIRNLAPLPAPFFGYRTNNTYEDSDFRNKLETLGIRSNADLINFGWRTQGKDYDWKGNDWAKLFRSDLDRILGKNWSDENIRRAFNTSGKWGKGFLGSGDFSDFQKSLLESAGVWNSDYDRRKVGYENSLANQLKGPKWLPQILNSINSLWTIHTPSWRNNLLGALNLSFYKKGGTLSPRDPVKRFKSFLKGGSLLKPEIRVFKTGGTLYSDETKKLLLEMINSGITKVIINGKEKVLKADGYRGPITEAAIALYLKSKGSGSATRDNKPYQLDYNKVKLLGDARRAQAQPMINNFNNYVEGLNKNASKNIEHKNKVYQTLNKNTKAPLAPNKDSELLDVLWKIGAFKGIKNKRGKELTYELAVDGSFKKMSELALKNAENMGYFIDRKSGTVSKTNPNKITPSETTSSASLFGNNSVVDFVSSFFKKSPSVVDNSTGLQAVLNHKKRYNINDRSWYFDPLSNTGYRIENGNIVDLFEITSGLNTKSDGYTPLTKDENGNIIYDRATNLSSTPGGIFTFTNPKMGYGERMYFLTEGLRGNPGTEGTNLNTAFHAPAGALRAALFNDGNNKNNCSSFGCISPAKGKLNKWDKELGSLEGDSVYVGFKDPRNYIKEEDGVLKSFFGHAPKEVSGKNYDKHYSFNNVLYNRGY